MGPNSHRLILTALAVTLVGIGCSSGSGDAAARCADPVEEPLDPAGSLHILPGAAVTYATSPPTSGPHTSGATPSGLLDAPLPAPVQVAVLERGDVLVQFDVSLDPDAVEAVQGLVADGVVAAPGADLPAPIVLTAWRWKLTCQALDLDAIDRFIADRAGAVGGP